MRLLKRRNELAEPDFRCLGLAGRRARVLHRFFLTAWVILPDPVSRRARDLRPSLSLHHFAGDEIHQDQFDDIDLNLKSGFGGSAGTVKVSDSNHLESAGPPG